MHQATARKAIEDCDIALVRKLWAYTHAHLPQPKTDAQALVVIHHARTQMQSVSLRLRAYSHRWLTDKGYPSALPDDLKPRAERMFPVVVAGVGVAVGGNGILKPVAEHVEVAMSDAVMDCCDGRNDKLLKLPTPLVKGRMFEARDKAKRYFADLLAGNRK
jgi:hypothetical protein